MEGRKTFGRKVKLGAGWPGREGTDAAVDEECWDSQPGVEASGGFGWCASAKRLVAVAADFGKKAEEAEVAGIGLVFYEGSVLGGANASCHGWSFLSVRSQR